MSASRLVADDPLEEESQPSSVRAGWRHVRFLLLHSPNHLFILPGAIMSATGGLISLLVLAQVDVFGRLWDLHALIGGSLLLIVGAQIVSLGLCAHAYATYFLGKRDPRFDRIDASLRLEHGLMIGGGLAFAGFAIIALIVLQWITRGFGSLSQERSAIFAATLLVLGLQVIFSSFLLNILGLRREGR